MLSLKRLNLPSVEAGARAGLDRGDSGFGGGGLVTVQSKKARVTSAVTVPVEICYLQ